MRLLPFLLAIAALTPLLSRAQDDSSSDNAVHAVTALHEDGSYTVTLSDNDKHSSESSTYDAAKHLIEKVVYTLDEDNKPLSGLVYGPDNAVAFKAVYKHDDFKRITEEDDYTLADQLIRRFTYDFGSDGAVIRVHAYDSQGNELSQSGAIKDQHRLPPRVH